MRIASLLLAALLLLNVANSATRGDEKKLEAKKPEREPDVVFLPTPQGVVEQMLELAKVTKDDILCDLGCGDGRIVITAAKSYECNAAGVDIDPARIEECEKNAKKENEDVQKRVKFEIKDFYKHDFSDATVVTLYLLPDVNAKLVPQLNKLKPGTRVVLHAFDIAGYKPDAKKTIEIDKREYDLFLYTMPLKAEKKDKREEKKEK
jgi:precorrin-6B methylase 2